MGNNKIVKTLNSEDRNCLVCGAKDVETRELRIDRTLNGANIVVFGICECCYYKMALQMIEAEW